MVAQRHLWRHAMTDPLNSVLFEIEQFGTANDASTTERPRRMLNITRDTGEFPISIGQSHTGSTGAEDWYVVMATPRFDSRARLARSAAR